MTTPRELLAKYVTQAQMSSFFIDKMKIYNVLSYGATGDGVTDDTTAIQNTINALTANTVLVLPKGQYKYSTLALKSNIYILGLGGQLVPASQSGGQITGTSLTNIVIEGVIFSYTAGSNYNPVISLTSCTDVKINNNRFIGCGFGALCTSCNYVEMKGNYGEQIGIYPRPAPLDATGAGYSANYNIYGAYLRAVTCNNVNMSGNTLRNTSVFSGNTSDTTGGAGGVTCTNCNEVTVNNNVIINAPGQGIAAVGALQGTDVVTLVNAGTIDETALGRNITITGNVVYGNNQEGITCFGVSSATITGNTSRNNRYHSIEVWDSRDVTVDGNITHEPSTADMTALGGTGAAGTGSIVAYRSDSVIIVGNKIMKARKNGIDVLNTTQNYIISGNVIGKTDLDSNAEAYLGHGIALNNVSGGVVEGNIQTVAPAGKYCYYLTNGATTANNYIYGNRPTDNIYGHYMGSIDRIWGKDRGVGPSSTEFSSLRYGRVKTISTTATTILSAANLIAQSGAEACLIIVNGCDDANGGNNFVDIVLYLAGATPVVLSSQTIGTIPARTYTTSSTNLQLAMASGTYSVRVMGIEAATGNTNAV